MAPIQRAVTLRNIIRYGTSISMIPRRRIDTIHGTAETGVRGTLHQRRPPYHLAAGHQ